MDLNNIFDTELKEALYNLTLLNFAHDLVFKGCSKEVIMLWGTVETILN